jgi:ribosomal protein L16 Arg81 hydroxylase
VKQAALAKEAEVRTASEKEYLDKSFRVYTLEEVDKRLSDAAESAKTQDAAIKKDILDAINSVVAKRLSNTEQQQLKTVISEELTAKFNDQLVPKIRDSIRQSLLTDEDFLKEIAKRIPRE